MRLKPPNRRAIFIALILVATTVFTALVVQPAWAANYVGYSSGSFAANCPTIACVCDNPACSASQCTSGGNSCEGVGDILIAPFSGSVQSISFFTSPSPCPPGSCALPNQFVVLTAPAGSLAHLSTPAGYCPTGGPGTTCGKENAGDTFTIQDVEALSGVLANTFTTVLLAGTVTVTPGQYVAVLLQNTANQGVGILAVVGQCPCLTTTYASHIVFQNGACPIGGNNGPPVVGGNACSDTGPSGPPIVGATFIPSTSPVTQFTQCYGNCGSPPITLVNTNSTRNINFNQSLTLFYEFQSQQNGFLLNATTNVAKPYVNGQTVTVGVYQVQSCPIGVTPFTNACPGLLQSAKNFVNPQKGQASMIITLNSLSITNGQWLAVAVSGLYAPLDLNDTNAGVQIFQTNGQVPAVITQATVFSQSSKIGLWAFGVGNIVNGNPSTVTGGGGVCAGLDCVLNNIVNSSCSVVNSACQTGSAIFWIIVLTIITFVVMAFSFNALLPGINIGRIGLGEMGILIFLMWVAIFASLTPMSPYVIVLTFMVVSVIFGKKVSAYI